MKRTEKLTLLKQVLTGKATSQRLQEAASKKSRPLVIIDDLDRPPGEPLTDQSPVHFHDKGVLHRTTLAGAHEYARKHRIKVYVILPDNKRDPLPKP